MPNVLQQNSSVPLLVWVELIFFTTNGNPSEANNLISKFWKEKSTRQLKYVLRDLVPIVQF